MEEVCEAAKTMQLRLLMSEPFQAFLGDIATLGIVPGDQRVTQFGVVSARSNERYWLIPIRPRAAALAGFALVHPVTWRAALIKAVAVGSVWIGLWPLCVRQRIGFNVSSLAANYFDRPAVHFAFFTGTDGPHRKTAIEFIDDKGAILGYAKITRQSSIAAYIRAEANFLRQLETLELESADVPKCITFEEQGAHAILVTDSKKTRRSISPKVMTVAHLGFLQELAEKTRCDADDAQRDRLAARLRNASIRSSEAWRERFELGLQLLSRSDLHLQVALAHGDFTPWNCFLEGGRLYVFDWEYADAAAPLGYDMMKFHTSLQGSIDPAAIGESIIANIANMYFDGNIMDARTHYHLALLLHSAFYFGRARSEGECAAYWQEEVQFAELIDALY